MVVDTCLFVRSWSGVRRVFAQQMGFPSTGDRLRGTGQEPGDVQGAAHARGDVQVRPNLGSRFRNSAGRLSLQPLLRQEKLRQPQRDPFGSGHHRQVSRTTHHLAATIWRAHVCAH